MQPISQPAFTDQLYSGIGNLGMATTVAATGSYGIGRTMTRNWSQFSYADKKSYMNFAKFGRGALKAGKWGLVAGIAATTLGAGYHISKTVGDIEGRLLTSINKIATQIRTPEYTTRFVDTRATFTMRQQMKRQMMDSAYSIRAVMGNEASLYH